MTCITGAGTILLGSGGTDTACDPTAFLRVRKSKKFMGTQDDLAVVATARALASADLASPPPERTGVFLAVGYIPFREEDIGPVLDASLTETDARSGQRAFDVRRFGAGGFQRAHPLLTFRCLPNMPAYHVSVNFDVQGPYCVTYPGPAQLYAALDEARSAIADGRVDVALVGAVAHQSNFLVRHHFARLDPPVSADRLRDVAAVIVLEAEPHARARGATIRARLESMHVAYEPLDMLVHGRAASEKATGLDLDADLGPALLPHAIASALGRPQVLTHVLESRDGISAKSEWVIA
jgi:3-oxoacyl-[acyl-carrier-protein] synthase II